MENQHLNRLNSLSYEELLEWAFNYYVKVFGEEKLNIIFEKVMTSNKISGLLSKSKYGNLALGSKDYLVTLNTIPYFIFSKPATIAVAAFIALERWNKEVNSQLFLLDEEGLHLRAMNILKTSQAINYIH